MQPSLCLLEAFALKIVDGGWRQRQLDVLAHQIWRNITFRMFLDNVVSQVGPAVEGLRMALATLVPAEVFGGWDSIVTDVVCFVVMSLLVVACPETLPAVFTFEGFALLRALAPFICRFRSLLDDSRWTPSRFMGRSVRRDRSRTSTAGAS